MPSIAALNDMMRKSAGSFSVTQREALCQDKKWCFATISLMETITETIMKTPFSGPQARTWFGRSLSKATALFQSIYSDTFPLQDNIL